jgi:hypothetical protein
VSAIAKLIERVARAPMWLLTLLFLPPLAVTLVVHLFDGYWWWRDFDAVLCAGLRAAKGLPIYAAHPSCPGLQPADYVYPPQIARLAAVVVGRVPVTELRAGFVAIQAVVVLWLGWLMLARPLANLTQRARIPALGIVDGGNVACGNIAIACHALVAASLLAFKRSRASFIVAVALISVIKPVYATYLVVLLLDKAPWRTRLLRGAAAALALAIAGVVVWRTAGAGELLAWQDALHRVVVHGKPGGGLLGLIARAGLPSQGLFPLAAFALYAGLMTLSGLAIVESKSVGFSADERWLFGLGLAMLINPRPLGYDFVVLAPAIAMTGLAAGEVSPRLGLVVRGWLLACCIGFWGFSTMLWGGQGAILLPPGLAIGVLAAGGPLAWRRLAAWLGARPAALPAEAVAEAPPPPG